MMKYTKAFAAFLIVCLMGTFVSVTAFAEGDASVVIGNKLEFEEGNEPFIYEGRTMMPLRAISEALDATVYWFSDTNNIQIVSYDTLLALTIGNSMMGKYKIQNGEPSAEPESIKMEVKPMIVNDRTYVPLRAISEAFDAKISWDNPNRSAIIIPNKKVMNNMSVRDMSSQPDGTLCAAYGVIGRDPGNGTFYLRSLTRNESGAYSQISFCTPKKTSMSDNTDYNEYLAKYWSEQFGTENPSGMVVLFTGVTATVDGATRVVLNKTTTSIKSLGYYDTYMKSLGIDCEAYN